MTVRALAVFAVFISAPDIYAQDAHNWTQQYGPRSSLLRGAVIGSVDDISATYYNPGALGLAPDLAFAITANVFERSGVVLEDGGGNGVDLGTARSGVRPSLVAGMLRRNLFGSSVLAYSLLTRVKGTQDFSGVAILAGSDIPPSRQLQEQAGLVQGEGAGTELWAGLT